MMRIVIAVVLFAHGIGHSLGLLSMFRLASVNPSWQGDSWLLPGVTGPATQLVGIVLWSISIVGFVAAAAAVMGWLPESWWAPLAVGSSIASLVGILVFPVAFPTSSTIAAAVVDAAVLLAVLWFHWTPSDLAA
jgi:hypothetical protein